MITINWKIRILVRRKKGQPPQVTPYQTQSSTNEFPNQMQIS